MTRKGSLLPFDAVSRVEACRRLFLVISTGAKRSGEIPYGESRPVGPLLSVPTATKDEHIETRCSMPNCPAYSRSGPRHDSGYSKTRDKGTTRPSSTYCHHGPARSDPPFRRELDWL